MPAQPNAKRSRRSVARTAAKRGVRAAKVEMYRRLILEAAERVFAAKGVDETRVEEIAAEAGLSLGTLYSAFKGKAEIVQSIHDHHLRRLVDASIEASARAEGDEAVLRAGIRGYVQYFLENPDYLKLHLHHGYVWGEPRATSTAPQAAAWEEGFAMLVAFLERGMAEGIFYETDPVVSARILIAAQQAQLSAWVDRGADGGREEVLDEVESFVTRAFCAR